MISNILFILKLILAFLPFALFAFLNQKANIKKPHRYRQFVMPFVALVYCIVMCVLIDQISTLCLSLVRAVASLFDMINLGSVGDFLRNLCLSHTSTVLLIVVNTMAMLLYICIKRAITAIFSNKKIRPDSKVGTLIGLFYEYDEREKTWFLRRHFGQARTFLKTAYYGGCIVCGIVMLITSVMLKNKTIYAAFYPVFALILIGEVAFFVDGLRRDEGESTLSIRADRSRRVADYALLRRPLRTLFGDKLASEGTRVNNGALSGGAVEDVLSDIEKNGGHVGRNYAAFIRQKITAGLKPNIDYVRSGYDLATGKSLLFNTPFYYKLLPYAFYAMHRHLLAGGKVLIVLGRHGTENDLVQWCEKGMLEVSNIPNLWKTGILSEKEDPEDDMPDIGLISRSGVHDLDIHRANLHFLKKVTLVIIVEPSRLVTTAQIGLNLLIKCCGNDRDITFCSVDQNCDGLVDSLSHILMTNITEVSATEYPHGTSSFMCWTADSDYVHHRMIPGISRYLGMGTELSFVALKNQVEKAVWYGGETYPVLDTHWIAKQYYYELLDYAKLPTTQETFDQMFQTSYNMCNESVRDYSYITVEDERNNLFEIQRNFATMSEKQGFINVISPEYMFREYMTENTDLFNADPKAIPFMTADYARTRRNAVLSICLKLCVEGVAEKELLREMLLIGMDTSDARETLWNEICSLFCRNGSEQFDRDGSQIIVTESGRKFTREDTLGYNRRYSVDTGRFENVYTIENQKFAEILLDDLQNAKYVAERDSQDYYIGSELKGHIYQKYLPGQFFTLNGKYYEMVSVAAGNRIIVRRASEHISGRQFYRQVRKYTMDRLTNSDSMGALRTINQIDVYSQFADITVETPAYWKMNSYQDFKTGVLVELNGVPDRRYYHKQILKLDFSRMGDAFTDEIRKTLTVLLNEAFVTLFADNQPFISAVTPGEHDIPITYSLKVSDEASDKCIYIVEDSQLDIGLLITVERNLSRIFQIISDYLLWNEEKIQELPREETPEEPVMHLSDIPDTEPPKKNIFRRFWDKVKSLFCRKKKDSPEKDEKKKAKKARKEEKKKAREARKEARKKAREARKNKKSDGNPETEQEAPLTPEEPAEGEIPADEPVPEAGEAPKDEPASEAGEIPEEEPTVNAPEETEQPAEEEPETAEPAAPEEAPKKAGWFRSRFGRKKKDSKSAETADDMSGKE